MDDEEIRRRGPQLVLGALMITLGGLLALFGTMYGPLAQPDVDELGVTVVADDARNLAALGATAATLLGAGAAWCYRGSAPMMVASGVVAVAGAYNLVRLLSLF